MKEIKDESFVVIENQVAMTEEAVADLLNIDVEKLRAVSDYIGITNVKGKIYEREGKYYYTSQEIIFKVRDTNDKKSADLSRGDLAIAFRKAEDRLLPADFVKAKRKKENKQLAIMVGVIVLFFVIGYFYNQSNKNTVPPTPVQTPAQTQMQKQTQTLPAAPVPVSQIATLGISPWKFSQEFNRQSKTIAPEVGFYVNEPQVTVGEKQNVFQYIFTQNLMMMGTVDKESGNVKEIMITAIPKTAEEIYGSILLYGVTLATLRPGLKEEERGKILSGLGLLEPTKTDFLKLDKKVTYGDCKYAARFIPQIGLVFTISPKDI